MRTLFILILAFPLLSQAKGKIQANFNAELNAQVKTISNTKEAKDLGDDWSNENIHLGYGNIFGRFAFKKSSLVYNWFFRYSESELYKNDSSASDHSNYPRRLLKRDAFKFSKKDSGERSFTESVLNRFAFEWGDEESRFKVGRMFIEYGSGKTFNPINPFSAQLTFSHTDSVQQGNDGVQFYIANGDDFKLHFYVLTDTQFFGDDRLTRTVMLRGDWQYSKDLHIQYIIGEDQKRHKYGGELTYQITGGKIYAQAVRNSQRLDKSEEEEEGLFHSMLGYEKEVTSKLNIGLEGGKYQISELYPEGSYQSNILPISAFGSLISSYQFTDKSSSHLNYAIDTESHFSFYHFTNKYKFSKNITGTAFTSGRASKAKNETKYSSQNLIPMQIGLGIKVKI